MSDDRGLAADHGAIDASIIICTYNRATRLDQTLLSLCSMNRDPKSNYEVLIVDNRSDDNTKEVATAWSSQLPIRYLYEPRPGLSHARNRGILESQGQYILFTDDDCIVTADWLTTAIRLLSDTPSQIIGGRVDLYDVTDRPVTIKVDDAPAFMASVADLLGFLHGCNMIFGRCVIDLIGYFDPLLGAGTSCKAGEDSDFVYRAFKQGIPVRYCPELRLAHNHGRKHLADQKILSDGYVLSLGAIALKHLLRGDISLLKLAYWALRSEYRNERRGRLLNYLRGFARYGYMLLKSRIV